MTLARRIIPCLDTDGARVVKGVHFEGLRDAGDPAELAARYDAAGADEIVVLDIAASRDDRATFVATIRRVAEALSIPLTAGGGIRSLDDARAVIDVGADKVSINSAAIERPELITELSEAFGAQAVVVAIDAKQDRRSGGRADGRTNSGFRVYSRGGRQPTDLEPAEWAARAEQLGAGEILLTSIDRDGTQSGFDLPLTRHVAAAVGVPVIASGGARTARDFAAVLNGPGCADAALAASIFHDGLVDIGVLKRDLASRGIPIRT